MIVDDNGNKGWTIDRTAKKDRPRRAVRDVCCRMFYRTFYNPTAPTSGIDTLRTLATMRYLLPLCSIAFFFTIHPLWVCVYGQRKMASFAVLFSLLHSLFISFAGCRGAVAITAPSSIILSSSVTLSAKLAASKTSLARSITADIKKNPSLRSCSFFVKLPSASTLEFLSTSYQSVLF